eukprot:c44247_g1_i1 orf=73-345(-)
MSPRQTRHTRLLFHLQMDTDSAPLKLNQQSEYVETQTGNYKTQNSLPNKWDNVQAHSLDTMNSKHYKDTLQAHSRIGIMPKLTDWKLQTR